MKPFVYLFFPFILYSSVAQQKIDSLKAAVHSSSNPDEQIETLSLIADQFQNPNEKIIYARQAYKLVEGASDKGKIVAANKMGICHGMLGQIVGPLLSLQWKKPPIEPSILPPHNPRIPHHYNDLLSGICHWECYQYSSLNWALSWVLLSMAIGPGQNAACGNRQTTRKRGGRSPCKRHIRSGSVWLLLSACLLNLSTQIQVSFCIDFHKIIIHQVVNKVNCFTCRLHFGT